MYDLSKQGVARAQKDLRVTIYCKELDKRQTGDVMCKRRKVERIY